MALKKKALENTVEKRGNAGNQHFSPFPTVLSKREIIILVTFDLSSANAFILVRSTILLFGKGLNKTLQSYEKKLELKT